MICYHKSATVRHHRRTKSSNDRVVTIKCPDCEYSAMMPLEPKEWSGFKVLKKRMT